MYAEYIGAEVDQHNQELEALVIEGCRRQEGRPDELRLYDLQDATAPCVAWLVAQVKAMAARYCGFSLTEGIEVALRGVVLQKFDHINTHTETSESDLGLAYWPSGSPSIVGSPINQKADGVNAPVFKLEDPSRHLSDLRLPMESRHSIDACPRPGLMAIYPAHLPHNMHPYRGEKPFIHIVAQVRMPWSKDYSKGKI